MPSSLEHKPLDAGDWFPWRVFVEVTGAACQASVLLLAAGGLLVSELGVAAMGLAMPETVTPLTMPATAADLDLEPAGLIRGSGAALRGYGWGFAEPFCVAWMTPLAVLVGGWRVVVWSLFAGAIAREAALRLTRRSSAGFLAGLRWSAATVGPRIGLFAGLLAVVYTLGLSVGLLGAGASLPVLGTVIGLALPVMLLLAAAAAVVGLAVGVGWPLTTASAAVERQDAFDAVSRGLAYAYQRPLRLAAYATQAAAVGVAGGVVVQLLVRTTLLIGLLGLPALPGKLTGPASFWWAEATRVPMVYAAAYFWCAATAIYLLLRRDIDEQQADEIFLGEEPASNEAGADQPPA